VSMAPIMKKNFPSASRYAKRTKSPLNPRKEGNPANGTSRMAHRTVARYISGDSRKIKLVVVLITLPFLSRTQMFFQGWKSPGPFRPLAILFTRRMIPGKNNAVSTASNNPVIGYSGITTEK
jgi:hypothetical protein